MAEEIITNKSPKGLRIACIILSVIALILSIIVIFTYSSLVDMLTSPGQAENIIGILIAAPLFIIAIIPQLLFGSVSLSLSAKLMTKDKKHPLHITLLSIDGALVLMSIVMVVVLFIL